MLVKTAQQNRECVRTISVAVPGRLPACHQLSERIELTDPALGVVGVGVVGVVIASECAPPQKLVWRESVHVREEAHEVDRARDPGAELSPP